MSLYKHVAVGDDLTHRCYTSTNGIDRHYLGCAHKTPRQAIKHTSQTYASPKRETRSEQR